MKAAYLQSPGQILVRDIPTPVPAFGEVLIKIHSVGVCASDIHYFEHGRIGRYVVETPLILGHEPAGEVVELGEKTKNINDITPIIKNDFCILFFCFIKIS